MKILRKLWCLFLILFACICILVLVCAFQPDVTKALAGFLYPEGKQEEDVSAVSQMNAPGAEEQQRRSERPDPVGEEKENRDSKQESIQESGEFSEEILSELNAIEAGKEGLDESVRPEYDSPEQSDLTVPQSVSGRNGYQRVQDEGGLIDDDEARALQNEIGPGNTGDDLTFDPVFYPYYATLDEKGKHLYRQIFANANDLYQVFAPVEEVTAPELKTVFAAVYNDHPELFWMETAYLGKYRRDGRCMEIDLRFNRLSQNLEEAKRTFNENAGGILAQAQSLGSDYEKEKLIHDILLERISYDRGAEMNQSAYSALVNGRTVCAGYARAFQYLLGQLGIPCYYCTGYAGESHAWNIVRLEDGYYNVDATWDDGEGGNYDFFNKTDQDYAATHLRQELSVYLPPCTGRLYRSPDEPTGAMRRIPGEMRGIEDLGIPEDEILRSLADYYTDCYNRILAQGAGTYEFSNVIEGDALFEEWYGAYQGEGYRQGYMNNAIAAAGASSCEMNLEVEELAGGRYLVTHRVNIQ